VDLEAAAGEQKLGITTVTRLAGEQGRDIEEELATYQREREMFRKYGKPHPDDIVEAEIKAASAPKAANADNAIPTPRRVALHSNGA
jgi:hypothetical protein